MARHLEKTGEGGLVFCQQILTCISEYRKDILKCPEYRGGLISGVEWICTIELAHIGTF